VCIGIPVQVERCEALQASCTGRGKRYRIDLHLLGEQGVGTWVLAFQGAAIRVLSAAEAARIDAALDAVEAALRGASDFDAYFRDLVDREPQLPEHLRSA